MDHRESSFQNATKVDRLYDRLDGALWQFTCANVVFVCFVVADRAVKKSCAGVFSIKHVALDWEKLAQTVKTRLGVNTEKIAFKICASDDAVARQVANSLTGFGFKFERFGRIGDGAKIRFDAITGGVRVEENKLKGTNDHLQTQKSIIKVSSIESKSTHNLPASLKAHSKVRVGIIDDARQIRYMLRKMISESPDFEVIWEAARPSEAMEMLRKQKPDVITLDLHMPEMNGAELLKQYIGKFPIPTIVISSLGKNESPLVFEALENGAVDYLQKPVASEFAKMRDDLHERLRAARHMKVSIARFVDRSLDLTGLSDKMLKERIVAIGASTGGTEALRHLLTQLPEKIPAIVVVQHIPPVFSQAFASRLNSLCPFEVKEAEHGDELKPGRVLIAPGGKHIAIEKILGKYKTVINEDAPVNRHRPSVDVLFDSVAATAMQKSIGIILTGMGGDGAKGLKRMRDSGARTFAQDEASCVVFGMPKEAIKLEAAEEVMSLDMLPRALMNMFVEVKQGSKIA